MTTFTQRLHIVFMLFVPVVILVLISASPSTSMAEGQQTSFTTCLAALRKEALHRGIPQKTLDTTLKDLKPIPKVIKLDRNQPEAKLTFDQYLSRVLTKKRVANGRNKLSDTSKLLGNIASRYGVEPRFLVALWGLETDFGRITGSMPVIESLVSLIYDGRRSTFFRKELIHALRILDDGHISLAQMKGSWAGAMGQLQFMPSTYRHFAVDFDGDGRIDIWKSQEDVFASAANYLSQSGWKTGQTWGQEVYLPEGLYRNSTNLKQQKSVNDWHALGIRTLDGTHFPSLNLLASIVQPDGRAGRTFLVYDNYHALRKWNRSHNFALSVGILSDQLHSP
ncbi:MAG: lytic murein transglycosylase [Deltaproteobacteria bacterium]|nr:MAG: lytic murein transglycosylase [Deltaproteobacteria bacterium]